MIPKVYFLVTIDGDLRVGTHLQQENGINRMREIHDDLGLFGRTTWMINEIDFCWTENHGELLLDLIKTGECIGVHDHLDTHYADSYDKALSLMSRSRHQIEGFFHTKGINYQIVAHRNGCAFQSEASYRAAKALGYSILSDVWPGMIWSGRMICDGSPPNPWRRLEDHDAGAITMDNSSVPLRAIPWRHDVDNWLEYDSKEGIFLQVPINSMPSLDRGRAEEAIQNSGAVAFVLLDTHPYDLQSPESGEVSEELARGYSDALVWIKNTYKSEFIRIDEVPDLWSGT